MVVATSEIVLMPQWERVLKYMQTNEQSTGLIPLLFVGKDLGAELEIKGIYPVLNALIARGLIEKGEPQTRPFTNREGKQVDRTYQTYRLTEVGRSLIIY